MPVIRETVEIKAPPERVWAVVQEDAVHTPRWSTNLSKIEKMSSAATHTMPSHSWRRGSAPRAG